MKSESGSTAIEFDKIDPLELEKIKKKIRHKAKKEKTKMVLIYIVSILLTALIFLLLFI